MVTMTPLMNKTIFLKDTEESADLGTTISQSSTTVSQAMDWVRLNFQSNHTINKRSRNGDKSIRLISNKVIKLAES